MLSPPPQSEQLKLQKELATLNANVNLNLIEHQQELLAIWYASPFIKRVCIAQPKWLEQVLLSHALHQDYDFAGYQQDLTMLFSANDDVEGLQRQLRRSRMAAFARIAWRDLQGYCRVEQTLLELSLYAQVCLQKTLHWCFEWQQSQPDTEARIKFPEGNIVIFALGKLGGKELNFSSDVDIVFSYADEADQAQDQQASSIAFNQKVVQLFIKVLSEQTQDGFVFRIDTRLRPFGESGPLLSSFAFIDQYFQLHGRDWERYAWIKARVVAGNMQSGERFLREITPFMYRRYFDYGTMQSLREMKALINNKARSHSGKEDLKIGIGGIREIEFIAQMVQLIYGGKNSALRISSTQRALAELQAQKMIKPEWVDRLVRAYLFLRKAENVLQMQEDQQVHVLPSGADKQARYAYAMGMQDWQAFHHKYKKHANTVNEIYQSLLQDHGVDSGSHHENEFVALWQQIEDPVFCIESLSEYFATHAAQMHERLKVFQSTELMKKLVPTARDRVDRFIPILLHELKNFNDPQIILERFLAILKNIAQRSTYIVLLIENKNKLSIIFRLIQQSPWIAQYLATHPLLLDDVLSPGKPDKPPRFEEMQRLLQIQLENVSDLERLMECLREFKHSQVIQIAAADIVQDYPIMKVSDHLSWLAEICLTHAVHYAYQELVEKYGEPQCVADGVRFVPEWIIVEYGKLGGLELGYGSDVDMVFLHNSVGDECETSGGMPDRKNKIHNNVFFIRLVQRTIHILSTVTSSGKVFDVDMRLRPHGESGPVAASLQAYKQYLLNEAWLWEHQALVRARAIPGASSLAKAFAELREKVLCLPKDINKVREAVVEMRSKMRASEDFDAHSVFNIKKSAGGIIDIEFIVQFLVLSHSSDHPGIAAHTDNLRILDACVEIGLLDVSSAQELQEIYLKYRKYLHQLNLQLAAETVALEVFEKERATVQKYWTSLLHSAA